MTSATPKKVSEIVDAISPELAERAAVQDAENAFVERGFGLLGEHRFFGAGVPESLGGLGAGHGRRRPSHVGIAESARDRALELVRSRARDPEVPLLVGEMDNHLISARQALKGLVDNAAEYDFAPTLERAAQALTCKTLAAKASIATVDKAMELVGGRSFFRKTGLERLMRDVRGAPFHPLPEKRQQVFTGRIALGMDPV